MLKILLLSAPIGSGHKITAYALEQELKKNASVEVAHGNVFDFFPSWVGSLFMYCYLKLLAVCPQLYAAVYRSGNKGSKERFLWLRNFLNRILLWRAEAYLDKLQPDIVIATHATPLGIMSLYKKQRPQLWLGAVVPDFNIHHWWFCEGVDMYFIADAALKSRFPENTNLAAWGLPLRQGFADCERTACRARYGYANDERVVLLLGGGEGLLPMEKILESLQRSDLSGLRLLAITGQNMEMHERLSARYAKKGIEVYAFREDIPELMCAADIIVSKAGALTAAEVLASGLAYIIYKPLPGQEQGNAEFLTGRHGAMLADSVEDIISYIREPRQPMYNKDLDIAARKMATRRICDYILQEKR